MSLAGAIKMKTTDWAAYTTGHHFLLFRGWNIQDHDTWIFMRVLHCRELPSLWNSHGGERKFKCLFILFKGYSSCYEGPTLTTLSKFLFANVLIPYHIGGLKWNMNLGGVYTHLIHNTNISRDLWDSKIIYCRNFW